MRLFEEAQKNFLLFSLLAGNFDLATCPGQLVWQFPQSGVKSIHQDSPPLTCVLLWEHRSEGPGIVGTAGFHSIGNGAG